MCVAPSLERFSLKGNLSKSLFYPCLESSGKRDFFFPSENHKTHVGDPLYSFNHLVTLQVNNLCLKFCILGLKDNTSKEVESTQEVLITAEYNVMFTFGSTCCTWIV